MSDTDILKRAQTALENIADWEKRHGKGINLVPTITDLTSSLTRIKVLCNHAIEVLEQGGEYRAEDLADQILAIVANA